MSVNNGIIMNHVAGKDQQAKKKAGNMIPAHLNKQKSQSVIVREFYRLMSCVKVYPCVSSS